MAPSEGRWRPYVAEDGGHWALDSADEDTPGDGPWLSAEHSARQASLLNGELPGEMADRPEKTSRRCPAGCAWHPASNGCQAVTFFGPGGREDEDEVVVCNDCGVRAWASLLDARARSLRDASQRAQPPPTPSCSLSHEEVQAVWDALSQFVDNCDVGDDEEPVGADSAVSARDKIQALLVPAMEGGRRVVAVLVEVP